MTLQQGALQKVGLQILNNVLLIGRQFIWIFRLFVNGRKLVGIEFVSLAVVESDTVIVKVDFLQHKAVIHQKIWIAFDKLPFEFKHNHSNGTLKSFKWLSIRINTGGERGKRPQTDSVAALQNVSVAVMQRVSYNGGNADL